VVRWPRDARDVRDGEHDEGETEHAARAGDGGGAGSDALLLARFGGGGTLALGRGGGLGSVALDGDVLDCRLQRHSARRSFPRCGIWRFGTRRHLRSFSRRQ
jgi:hypothetical protein